MTDFLKPMGGRHVTSSAERAKPSEPDGPDTPVNPAHHPDFSGDSGMSDTNALADKLEALQYLATWFDGAVGRLTPDYGEVTGKHFQAMTMCPDPEKLAKAMASLPAIIAALRTAERAEQALAERDAEVALLKAVAWNWLSYDQLLRQYSGPMERLGAGDWELADTTYDKCVEATVAALGGTDD